METGKFYFIHYYALYAISGWQPIGEAINKHPFLYMEQDVKEWAGKSISDWRLASWQEITEEEYKYALNSDIV